MDDVATMTEEQLRDYSPEWPRDISELNDLLTILTTREHDYGTCVYAMSIAAVAAFHFVAGKLGVTGFQASCADMDILKRTRHLKGGFRLIDYDAALYPQNADRLECSLWGTVRDNPKWFNEQATILLAERHSAHPDVVRHWEEIIDVTAPLLDAQP